MVVCSNDVASQNRLQHSVSPFIHPKRLNFFLSVQCSFFLSAHTLQIIATIVFPHHPAPRTQADKVTVNAFKLACHFI